MTDSSQAEFPIFDFSYVPESPKDEPTKKVYENMKKVEQIYMDNPDLTLRVQITEEAFDRLKDRPGIKGSKYSRLKEVITDDKVEYYLVVSPYTNVQRIGMSKDQNQKALTLSTNYFSVQRDDETINFQLAEVSAKGVSEVRDRSEVYPRDLLKIEFIQKDEAEKFISVPNTEIASEKGQKPKKQSFDTRLADTLRKVLSPERATELLSSQIMMQIEIVHDMQLYPEKYGMTQDQAGRYLIPDNPPFAEWAWNHMGDIWEISAGFTAMRLGFVALNEVLKKEPIAKLTHGYQVSDEAAFWTSLMTTWTVKAAHSMGWISSNWLYLGDMPIGAMHDHTVNPVPEMIFGQGVAAAVLVASHYAAKYREPIKNLVIRAAKFTGRKFKEFDTMMNNLGRPSAIPDVVVGTSEQGDEKEVF